MNNKVIDISKYKNKGYTGLVNLGNTCFLNSCIQVLNHTYELIEILNDPKYLPIMKQDLPDYSIIKEWMDLREVMWANDGVVSPNKFVYNVHKLAKEKNRDIFTGWAQNDMSEFLLFIIECIHNSMSRSIHMKISGNKKNNLDELAIQCYTMLQSVYSKEYSNIMEIFYGIYVSQIISNDGKIIYKNNPENFFILDLPIPLIKSNSSVFDSRVSRLSSVCDSTSPTNSFVCDSASSTDSTKETNECSGQKQNNNSISLYDCFDLFTQEEILENENAWFNEESGLKENIQKRIIIWSFPEILVITLKRFSQNGERKLNDLVNFPVKNLNLKKYVKGYNANNYKYDLYGVCNHYGSVLGGHYTSYVKNALNEWVHYNDSNVEIVQNMHEIVSPMAYCLFYRKKNNLL